MTDASLLFNAHTIAHILFGGAGIIGASAAAGTFFNPKIAQNILPKPEDTRLADFLPFDYIIDGETVSCKGDLLMRCIGIGGTDQSFLSEEEIHSLTKQRSSLYLAMAERNIVLRVFTIRRPMHISIPAQYPSPIVRTISAKWDKQFENSFRTRTIIMITRKGQSSGNHEMLKDIENEIMSLLSSYNAAPITENPKTSPWGDVTLSSFLGQLVSPVSTPTPHNSGIHLKDGLTGDEVAFFKNGRIRFRNGDQEKYSSVIGIRKLGTSMDTATANRLSSLPFESIYCQTIRPISKMNAILMMKQNQLMMKTGSFTSESVQDQYDEMIELIEGKGDHAGALCEYSQNLFIFAEDENHLSEAERYCRDIFTQADITPVIEKGASQSAWFGQFPTYEEQPRSFRLTSDNIAVSANFDTPPEGLWNSCWGKHPISLFNTGSNTTYSFQFHQNDDEKALGHGVCFARSGGGKTVFMEFLSCMASRNTDIKHFFFDRYKGSYVYTTAMGGKYIALNADQYTESLPGGMNPFLMPDTIENRSFLKTWLQSLTGLPLDDDEAAYECTKAVDAVYDKLPPQKRKLSLIRDILFNKNGAVYKRLHRWTDPNMHGSIFNADEDVLDTNASWLTTFDMTRLMDDAELAGPSVTYIMHRIRQVMTHEQCPAFIFIDETEPLLHNPQFREIYMKMLQEFRKLGAVVISSFQRTEAIRASGITKALTQNSANFFLFPNKAAQASDFDDLNLTERELNYVLGTSGNIRGASRTVLIKRPATGDSIVLDVDLSPIGDKLRLFSSDANEAIHASNMQRQYGEKWVEHFLRIPAPKKRKEATP